eukprot:5134674-Amphidinium_carterae.1
MLHILARTTLLVQPSSFQKILVAVLKACIVKPLLSVNGQILLCKTPSVQTPSLGSQMNSKVSDRHASSSVAVRTDGQLDDTEYSYKIANSCVTDDSRNSGVTRASDQWLGCYGSIDSAVAPDGCWEAERIACQTTTVKMHSVNTSPPRTTSGWEHQQAQVFNTIREVQSANWHTTCPDCASSRAGLPIPPIRA